MVWKVMYKWVFLICVDQKFGKYKPTNIFFYFWERWEKCGKKFMRKKVWNCKEDENYLTQCLVIGKILMKEKKVKKNDFFFIFGFIMKIWKKLE